MLYQILTIGPIPPSFNVVTSLSLYIYHHCVSLTDSLIDWLIEHTNFLNELKKTFLCTEKTYITNTKMKEESVLDLSLPSRKRSRTDDAKSSSSSSDRDEPSPINVAGPSDRKSLKKYLIRRYCKFSLSKKCMPPTT